MFIAREISNSVTHFHSNFVACQDNNRVIKSPPMATQKRRQLSEDEKSDVKRLRELLEERKKTEGMTQESLASLCEWSGQSAVQGFLSERTPINLDAALRLSKAFNVPMERISPRLAAKAIELFGATQAAQERPQTIDDLLLALHDDINNADNDVRKAIVGLVKAYQNNPTEGERIARSIRALLGEI